MERVGTGRGITSSYKIVANIFISFIGAGMLGLPYAFKESGILEGVLVLSIVGYLSVSAMLMLIDCKYAILSSGGCSGGRSIIVHTKVPMISPDSSDDEEHDRSTNSSDMTYGDVGLYALGSCGKRLVDIVIILSQVGFCCGYLIYLCENLTLYLPTIGQKTWLALLLPPIYALTLLRHLDKLALFSLFAQFSNILALSVVFWFDFAHFKKANFHPKEASIEGFPFFFSIAIYCYEGAGMILSLEESVAESMRIKFRSIFIYTMVAISMLYISFGISGYISYGPYTREIITLNLPQNGNSLMNFSAMVKICLGISLFFTYPMMMFPVSHMLDKALGITSSIWKANSLRFLLVLITGIVVVAVPNFAILISLIGATCCTLLAFILPATFHIAIFKNRLSQNQLRFNVFLIILGVVGSLIGLWDVSKRMGHTITYELEEQALEASNRLSLETSNITYQNTPSTVLSTGVLISISVSRTEKINVKDETDGTTLHPTSNLFSFLQSIVFNNASLELRNETQMNSIKKKQKT